MKTVLVAEDENSIREFITINLRLAGYEIIEACDGRQAIEKYDANRNSIDIAVLDIMMPGCDGIEVCRHIREKNMNVGIIFLTAKAQEHDKVSGLISGADDYITKPFSTTELIARVEALYRRVDYSRNLLSITPRDSLILGEFELDLKKHVLFKRGKEIELTHIEYQILECFFNKPEESIERGVFVEKVWGDKYYGDDKVVDVNIRRLRLKIEDDPSNPTHLITVWGQGYRWIT
ncbi:MAG: response regulator transcription factor [Clostridia bacterium]|nr:response regulator transcription factor [Clostridia bacterium]MBO7319201.1 response regulator transcription factor [Clostridia bacterium]